MAARSSQPRQRSSRVPEVACRFAALVMIAGTRALHEKQARRRLSVTPDRLENAVLASLRCNRRGRFGAGEDGREWRVECLGDPDDVREGDVALASLDGSVVGAVEAALQREGFLGDALFFAYGADRVA